MGKLLTSEQIDAAATLYGIEPKALKAVIKVECRGEGFNDKDEPTILFERHKFYKYIANGLRLKTCKEHPDICNPNSGNYGLESAQHSRLQAAAKIDRTAALMSASWGIGQVMGYHWRDLGYPTLQAFINAMYKDEASQLDAMLRYIKKNGLIGALNCHDWLSFEKGYNGNSVGNTYHERLAKAYTQIR